MSPAPVKPGPPEDNAELGVAETGPSDEDDAEREHTASGERSGDEPADGSHRCGTVIAGKYRLVAVLGAGGMGTVYEARHAFTSRRVAVKLLHASLALSGKAAMRFVREARAPASIGHPGIIEILDGGREPDGTLYIVEELLDGEDLQRAFSKGLLSAIDLVGVMIQTLDALEAAHSRGFIHRDVKPENIFILRSEHGLTRARLLDFGVAKRMDGGTPTPELTAAGTVIGTAWYMSPEQARGEVIDARADLWAIGAVMFHGLAGHRAIDGDNYNMMIARLITEDVPSLAQACPKLPTALIAFVDRALQRDIAKRWSTAAEMRDALRVIERQLESTAVIAPVTPRAETVAPGSSASIPPILDPRGASIRPGPPADASRFAPSRSARRLKRAAIVIGALVLGAGAVSLVRNSGHLQAAQRVPSIAPARTPSSIPTGTVPSETVQPIASRLAGADTLANGQMPDVLAALPSRTTDTPANLPPHDVVVPGHPIAPASRASHSEPAPAGPRPRPVNARVNPARDAGAPHEPAAPEPFIPGMPIRHYEPRATRDRSSIDSAGSTGTR